MNITINWTSLKDIITTKNLTLNYADLNDNYYLYASTSVADYSCIINKTNNSDQTDFETNYKSSSMTIL